MKNYFNLDYIEISQNIGTFFLTKMTPFQLHQISNKNLSRYKDAEKGIQRDISIQKSKEIKKYIESHDATFPNTIIIGIQNNPELEKPFYFFEKNKIHILAEDCVANILDGQHRLSGFEKDNNKFELPVSIFLDISLAEQSKIFAKINSTQSKVSLDLVYELFSLSETRNKEKTAFAIVNELNVDKDSPWFGKIKTLSDRTGDMAQGSFAKYIHKELIDKGKILENLFNDNRDDDLKSLLMNFFIAIKNTFPEEWENKDNNFILTKTTGFIGSMSFFKDLIKVARNNKEAFSVDFCQNYLDRIKTMFGKLDSNSYESGVRGQAKIRDIFRSGLTDKERQLI